MVQDSKNMMRIAIAGSGGLAQTFAHYLNETAHPFIILSRQARPELTALEYQVAVVNYDNTEELRFALRGVDIVISTVSGQPQIKLIDAAAHSRVRRFVPAEFEGPPARRRADDPLDNGKAAALERLRHWGRSRSHPMSFTIFCCGVFYERFSRGGLAAMGIATTSHLAGQGSYLMDVEASTAEVVEQNAAGQDIYLCLTSVNDLAKFLVAALERPLQSWPIEYRMYGDRRTVAEVLRWAEAVKGGTLFATEVIQARDLPAHLQYALHYQDFAKVGRMQELITTEQRRYDFTQPNLNPLTDIVPITLWDWLNAHWIGP